MPISDKQFHKQLAGTGQLKRWVEVLDQVTTDLDRIYPSWMQQMDRFRKDRRELGDWPKWCLVPMAGTAAIVERHKGGALLGNKAYLQAPAVLSSIYAWQWSRTVWVFDPDLSEALDTTENLDSIPYEALYQMPEWCIAMPIDKDTLSLTWLEWDVGRHEAELRIQLFVHYDDSVFSTFGAIVHLGQGSLTAGIEAAIEESKRQLALSGGDHKQLPELYDSVGRAWTNVVRTVVPRIVYLCSDKPDISMNTVTLNKTPQKNPVRRARRPERQDVAKWEVGFRFGAVFRQAKKAHASGTSTGQSATERHGITPHMRRAHWHMYWTGPKTGTRVPVVHWMHPMIIGGTLDKVVPTVRRVAKNG
jgi:hypothetical protein